MRIVLTCSAYYDEYHDFVEVVSAIGVHPAQEVHCDYHKGRQRQHSQTLTHSVPSRKNNAFN